MKEYKVSYGQSLYDVALNIYGNIESVWKLIDDNNLIDGLDTDLTGGQTLLIQDTIEQNNTIQYFQRFPAIVNNSDFEEIEGIINTLQIILLAIGNEINGGDGFINIEINGGKAPFSFEWKNEFDQLVSTSQNLTAASSGTYSITVTDANSNTTSSSFLVISVGDNNTYLVDEFGNIISDENGNPIIVPN